MVTLDPPWCAVRVAEAIEGGAMTLGQVLAHAQQSDTQTEHPQLFDGAGIGNDQTILLSKSVVQRAGVSPHGKRASGD
jgi:hypothetical protein